MKRLKRNKPLSSLVGLSVLVVVIAFTKSASSQDKNPAVPFRPKNSEAAAESKPKQLAAGSWTCSMHRQIHQARRGKCPICGMHLIVLRSHGVDSLMSLDRMLSLALRHNPGVRAVQADVIAAEAELDQTRLEVVQKIIAYRQRWRVQQATVSAVTTELEAAQRQLSTLSSKLGGVPDELRQRFEGLVRSARSQLPLAQARLKEIEAELPFLLGRQAAPQADAAAGSKDAIIRDRLISKIEQLVKVMVKESQTGSGTLSDVLPWSKRLAELKLRTATTKAERIAAVRSHIEWAKSIAKITAALYRTGKISQLDVLAAEIRLAEAELWLTEVGENSR